MRNKGYIEEYNPQQPTSLPECLDETIPAENLVRLIAVYVDQLNMEVHGFARSKPAGTGRPAYDPRLLLKLYLHGYPNRIRSSRRLEREAHRNIELACSFCC